jgi:hypothetical protein
MLFILPERKTFYLDDLVVSVPANMVLGRLFDAVGSFNPLAQINCDGMF